MLYAIGISNKIHQGNALIVQPSLDTFFLRDTSANADPPKLDRSGRFDGSDLECGLAEAKAASQKRNSDGPHDHMTFATPRCLLRFLWNRSKVTNERI